MMLAFSIRGALCAAALVLLAAPVAGSKPEVLGVTPGEVQRLLSAEAPPLLLDVRSEAEFRAGHIAGATHIPHDEIAARIGEIQVPEAGVIVYCHKGPRARIAEKTLLEQGIARVLHLQDGFSGWEAAGFPVER
jgi:phage shock protein E